jgi:hypothetical protein
MARATYANVRRYLGKKFDLSTSYSGRGGRGNLSEGVMVRSSHFSGVLVEYVAGSTAYSGSDAKAELEEIRAYLSEKYTVTDYAPGRLSVTDKD